MSGRQCYANKYMSSLNKQQYIASLPGRGVSLVIAGAGTGKTKTIVEKVKNIIAGDIAKPENILILTFSSKAGQEIKDRVRSGLHKDAEAVTSGTFHSFCLSLLKKNSGAFLSSYGFKDFPRIIDQEEKNKLQGDMLRGSLDAFLGLPANVVSGLLENNRLDKRTFNKLNRLGIIRELKDFSLRFKAYKISNNLIDFGDMMEYAIDLLSNNKSVREDTVYKYKYILVDEFQDTSEDNFKLLNLILHDEPDLFMVGDDWQSIYGFRGSRIEYTVRMKKFFPEAEIHKLNLNYRSRKEIIKLSNDFIKKNKYRTSKRLKSARGKGGLILDLCVSSLDEEAEAIKNILEKEKNNKPNDIAILYRNNWQGDYITKKLKSLSFETGHVKFMTIHSSKGLEFDTVIIAGVSDDIIPDSSNDIEEERRLFYVALTRARDSLYIVHHRPADGGLSLFAQELGFAKHKRH